MPIQDNLRYFYENCDFDMLMAWFSNADPVEVALNPFVLGPLIIIVAMLSYRKTTEMAQSLIAYTPVVGYLTVTFVVLKNDIISSTGPFIMAMVSFFIIIGWLLWTKLLK